MKDLLNFQVVWFGFILDVTPCWHVGSLVFYSGYRHKNTALEGLWWGVEIPYLISQSNSRCKNKQTKTTAQLLNYQQLLRAYICHMVCWAPWKSREMRSLQSESINFYHKFVLQKDLWLRHHQTWLHKLCRKSVRIRTTYLRIWPDSRVSELERAIRASISFSTFSWWRPQACREGELITEINCYNFY